MEGLCWGLTCFLEAEASGILCAKPGVSGRQSRSPGSWEQENQGFRHEPGAANPAKAWLNPMSPAQASVSPFACQVQGQRSQAPRNSGLLQAGSLGSLSWAPGRAGTHPWMNKCV